MQITDSFNRLSGVRFLALLQRCNVLNYDSVLGDHESNKRIVRSK